MGPLADVFGAGLGVAAGLLVAGWVLVRWQRDRHRFLLMRAALEKGITRFPDAPPYWLLSLRQAVTMLALGVSLAGVGAGAWWMGRQVAAPAVAGADGSMHPMVESPGPPPPDDAGPRRPPRPPAPNPQMERWHQAQNAVVLGLASVGVGIVLSVVGLVQVFFAQIERQYAAQSTSESSWPGTPGGPSARGPDAGF